MKFRPAQSGDIFILLTPDHLVPPVPPAWQVALQAQYGGQFTLPLHVSLQRFVCADEAQLLAFQKSLQAATAGYTPIAVHGITLQPVYSAFRQAYILKCGLQPTDAIAALCETVLQQLAAHELLPQFSWQSDHVTVLENINPPVDETEIDWYHPEPLFIGQVLLLSEVLGQNEYLHRWQWPLAG